MDEKEILKLPELNVGVVGHIDHGKTTLVSKLTGKFTDTHSEELKRGITIKLGYSELIIYKCEKCNSYSEKEICEHCKNSKGKPIRYASIVDAPGHEMLMATMLSGAAIIDAAILVIAANEGIKPQTREHLAALEAKKIKEILIVQNKIDLVDKEKALESYKEIKEFVKGTVAENAPIVPVSAQQRVNLEEIFRFLGEVKIKERNLKDKPIFLVARSFDINRPGTPIKNLSGSVLGGVLKQGVLKVGDKIEIQPGIIIEKAHQKSYKKLKTKISGLRKGKFSVDKITPGGSVAIETELDTILGKTDRLSGCIVGLEDSLPETADEIKIKYKLFEKVYGTEQKEKSKTEPIKPSETLLLSIDTTITVGVVRKTRGSQEGEFDIELKIPVTPIKGSNLGIARNIDNHWRLIGYGEIIK